jgi:hydrogenase maturation protein HypF
MRLKVNLTGLLQGVGFRPFVFRLAEETGLKGYVLNDTTGVTIEVEGPQNVLEEFLIRLDRDRPPISRIFSLQHSFLPEKGFTEFEVRESEESGKRHLSILPDISVCNDCIDEVTAPKDRRFIYPFINCTNCGPRFTIIERPPYDRHNTSMKDFAMCPDCSAEYNNPENRRFHAQPNACHKCGPWISLYDASGGMICEREDALEKATNLLRKGYIIAIKGLGGYHLVCDALNDEPVKRLRERKHREEKPMAVMFPDIKMIHAETHINPAEERAILSIEKPIVIVRKKADSSIAPSVSPDNETLGVFLPYTPLHYLLLRKLRRPVVATSANLTDEPIACDEADAFSRLAGIAEYFLTHNRDIVRRCDDSVVRIIADRQVPIRRSRGFVPLPLRLPFRFSKPVLALGPYMNNTFAVGIDNLVYLSQHIGDLDTPLAHEFFEESIRDMLSLLAVRPEIVVSDLHPGYYSTRYGEEHYSEILHKIQHHYAHILSCMAENEIPEEKEVIGFAFDGTGYGPDNTIWGSEVIIASYSSFRRAFHLRPYRLPGGEKAVKEPCRSALSLLYETFGDEAVNIPFSPLTGKERSFLIEMIRKGVNSPFTSSMGRMFDAVASLLGLNHRASYHAQAAMALEQTAMKSDSTESYPYIMKNGIIYQMPVIQAIVEDLLEDVPRETIARKFHNTVADIIVSASDTLRRETGISMVVLSGGVFQNALITEGVVDRLTGRGFTPLVHQLVPPNDGGIALGQAVSGIFI